MSDIGLNISGIIAMFVFAWSAGGSALFSFIGLMIASEGAAGTGFGGIKKQRTFSFSVTAAALMCLNILALAVLAYFVDSINDGINEMVDKFALYAWVPLQLVVWIT
jgi:hypothetical protein